MTREAVEKVFEGDANATHSFRTTHGSAKLPKRKWEVRVSGKQEFAEDGTETNFNGTVTWLGRAQDKESGLELAVTFVDGKVTEKKLIK